MLLQENLMIKKIIQVAFLMTCTCLFASWTEPNARSIESPLVNDSYTETQFFKDAYSFRVRNNHEIPLYYYEKLNIPSPQPVIETPVIEKPEWKSPIPEWILRGILATESRSYYDDNFNIVYVDKRIGTSGERGPFQLTPIAFKQIRKKGEIHSKVMKDMTYAQDLTERYLLYLYNGPARKDWEITIRMYNGGPSNYKIRATQRYLTSVKKLGNKK
jgi:hypothetical protein